MSRFVDTVYRGRVVWEFHDSDCHCLLPEPPLTDLELLELELEQSVAPRTCGTRRPQALRQARARRTALLRRLGA